LSVLARAVGESYHSPMSVGRPLTLRDILEHEEFELRLICGADTALQRPVVGVHCTEVEDPMRWLEPDWVMLTTGMRLKGAPAAQRELIAQLDEGRLAALGFGVGMTFASVPAALLDEAERRQFPLFVVPYSTAFNQVVAFGARSVLSGDLYTLRRVGSMQKYLMDSLDAESPDEELVYRLGTVLDCDVALRRPDGHLEALYRPGKALAVSPGTNWGETVWREVRQRPASLQRFIAGRRYVISTPVEAAGRVRYWLIVTSHPRGTTELLGKAVVESAARLLSVIVTAKRITAAEERAQHAELLQQVTDPVFAGSHGLGQRFAANGIDFTERVRALVVATREQRTERDSSNLHAVTTRLERLIAAAHVSHLVAERADRIVALLQGAEEQLRSWTTALSGPDVDVVIGIGRSVSTIGDCAASLSDAGLAVEQLRRPGHSSSVLRFEDFDLTGWLVSGRQPDDILAKVDESLAAIKARPPLYETLRCYLEVDLDVARAASALNLHPNSLRYRLCKIEEAIGAPLRRPGTIANLYIAMLIEDQTATPPRLAAQLQHGPAISPVEHGLRAG
jgi:purine catabolism regulator